MAGIKIIIEGAKDSTASYDDEAFLEADGRAYEALVSLYEAGGRVDNVGDVVMRALIDAGAAEGEGS